jgi:hypothetical protein
MPTAHISSPGSCPLTRGLNSQAPACCETDEERPFALVLRVVFSLMRMGCERGGHEMVVTVVFVVEFVSDAVRLEGVVHVGGRRVKREPAPEGLREHDGAARLVTGLQVVESLKGSKGREAERQALALAHEIPAPEQLERLVEAGAMHARLEIRCDSEAVLEPEECAVVEGEEVGRQVREVAECQVAREAMGESEIALMRAQRLRGWQRDDVELDLRVFLRPGGNPDRADESADEEQTTSGWGAQDGRGRGKSRSPAATIEPLRISGLAPTGFLFR